MLTKFPNPIVFVVFLNQNFIIKAHVTHTAALNTLTAVTTNYVTHRIFDANFHYPNRQAPLTDLGTSPAGW